MMKISENINFLNMILGIIGFTIFLIFPISETNILASNMAAIAILMAIWWMTEAVPISVTSLVPLVLVPLLGIETGKKISSLYLNSIVFLFMGGFLIAIAMEKWNLHKRIALNLINSIGNSPKNLILGFMISSFLLSMFISNTATTIMMLPIGLGIISKLESDFGVAETRKFSIALMLGIAYSASIGGTATLIGTAPNLAFKTIYEATFPDSSIISFSNWLIFALPIALLIMLVIKVLLVDVFFRPSNVIVLKNTVLKEEIRSMKKMLFEEKVVLIILSITSLLWIFRTDINVSSFSIRGWSNLISYPNLIDDGTVSIGMALLLFMIPSKSSKGTRILDKTAITKMPWGIILLFGGGFALAHGFETTGLSVLIGNLFSGLKGIPTFLITLLICLMMTFITELTSNTATTYTMLPIFAAIAVSLNIDPLAIMIPATMTASFAFMLPVATPPNAIVFSSEKLKIKDMARVGVVLNIVTVLLITTYYSLVGEYIWIN